MLILFGCRPPATIPDRGVPVPQRRNEGTVAILNPVLDSLARAIAPGRLCPKG
jgi:hypothetical protein